MIKENFVLKLLALDEDIKFQYWYMGKPSLWRSYKDVKLRCHNLFMINKQFLRQGIETPLVAELRLDIDVKDKFGKKSFQKCLETGQVISDILIMNKIKMFSTYVSGGDGLHIHLLYDNTLLCNYDPKKVRELICKYLNIYKLIDPQLLSNKQMLTLEGYEKRNSETHQIKKLYIGGSDDTLINENYCNEINLLPDEVVNYVLENYYVNEKSSNTLNSYSKLNNLKKYYKPTAKVILKHLKTFARYYNENQLKSTNTFYTIVITWLYKATQNIDATKVYFDVLFDTYNCKNNMTCSREQKVGAVVDAIQNNNWKSAFFENEYITKDKFYTLYDEVII